MQRSVAIDPSDRRFRPFDALVRLVVAVVGIAAITGPFRRTIYLVEGANPFGLAGPDTWYVFESSIVVKRNLHYVSPGYYMRGNIVQVTTTPGGALIEFQHYSRRVLELTIADAVGAVTAPPIPLILAVATVMAVLNAVLCRRA